MSNGSDETAQLVRRVLVDGDYVVNHSVVIENGRPAAIRFDLWRTNGDDIVERWHNQEPWQTQTANGHTQMEGPTHIDPSADSEATRKVVIATVETILVNGDASNVDKYLAGEDYVQHNHRFGNGTSALVQSFADLAKQGVTMQYDGISQVVADGDFAYTRSEGHLGEDRYVFHDLFRVAGGRCVEHWDVMVQI